MPALSKCKFLEGQSESNIHAGPSFSISPSSNIQPTNTTTFPTLPPRPTSSPPPPPSHPNPYKNTPVNTSYQGMTFTSSNKLIEAELIDTEPSRPRTIKPVNQTKCRQAIIQKAKDNATKFLGKFLFGKGKMMDVLPPVEREPTTFRDLHFNLEIGKNSQHVN